MKLQLLSDLHLERDPSRVFHPAPGAQVLVLAGDIASYQTGSLLDSAHEDFGLTQFSPTHRPPELGPGWPVVLFVPGNHEYDERDLDATHTQLQALCHRLGITWLDRRSLVLDGVRYVGTTLWADFEALAREQRAAKRDAALEKAYRAANFYLRKHTALREGKPLLAADLRELSLASQDWLRAALAQPFDGPTVAVTHFAPSLRSLDPRYGRVPGTAGFCNALDDLLPAVDLWLHGHVHCRLDYTVHGVHRGRPSQCRVVAHPLGYAHKGEQEGWDAAKVMDVPGIRN